MANQDGKMPRGAIATPRSELAASESYRPDAGAEIFVPSGVFPTPNHELAAAHPYRADGAAPESFLSWPIEISSWDDKKGGNSIWAEEAFAKACAEPKAFIPAEIVLRTALQCGSANFARFMQTNGFQLGAAAYLDGPFNTVDWTNAASLHAAISRVGPVKIGVASVSIASSQGHVTPGASGWAICDCAAGYAEDYCASLCGYGSLAALIARFKNYGIEVNAPSGMPAGHCYAMFAWGSIGVIDRKSLMNIAGEAWVRNPTTIFRNLSG
jgi:hypothetical protein